MFRALLQAARLRTLPLAIAGISLGSILAAFLGWHRWAITITALLTAVLLQVLSNFANDYGDYLKGVDKNRTDRALASGSLSIEDMKRATLILAVLCLFSGVLLLYVSFKQVDLLTVIFLLLGLLSIYAAIKYTAGKNPYGYRGLGDLAVFVFFGIVGVGGTYFLHNPVIDQHFWLTLLPASSFGLLSVGVLNINNIRDIESDRSMNKKTFAVALGAQWALRYQLLLIISAFVLLGFFMHRVVGHRLSVFLLLPIFLWQWIKLRSAVVAAPREVFNLLLKQMVLMCLFFVAMLAIILLL